MKKQLFGLLRGADSAPVAERLFRVADMARIYDHMHTFVALVVSALSCSSNAKNESTGE